jgi:hypothetical protein
MLYFHCNRSEMSYVNMSLVLRMSSPELLHHVTLVRTNISEEHTTPFTHFAVCLGY